MLDTCGRLGCGIVVAGVDFECGILEAGSGILDTCLDLGCGMVDNSGGGGPNLWLVLICCGIGFDMVNTVGKLFWLPIFGTPIRRSLSIKRFFIWLYQIMMGDTLYHKLFNL